MTNYALSSYNFGGVKNNLFTYMLKSLLHNIGVKTWTNIQLYSIHVPYNRLRPVPFIAFLITD
jgi:hypothetical protein